MKLKNFLRGMGSALELCPSSKEIKKSSGSFIKDDREALYSDWKTVGFDIKKAAKKVARNAA